MTSSRKKKCFLLLLLAFLLQKKEVIGIGRGVLSVFMLFMI